MIRASEYIGYTDGYSGSRASELSMQKESGLVDGLVGGGVGVVATGAAAASELLPYILLLPPVVGGLAGHIHSRVTSPSKIDFKTIQKAIELSDLEKLETDLTRRREQALIEEGSAGKGGGNERALRI